jgi:hypothetical protein
MLAPITTGKRFALCPISPASEDSNQPEVYAAAPNRYEKSMLLSTVVLARETPISRATSYGRRFELGNIGNRTSSAALQRRVLLPNRPAK